MTRHPTDLLSLLFGLSFMALAVAARSGVLRITGSIELRWIWPALLIGGGLSLLAGLTRSDTTARAPAADTPDEAGDPPGDAPDAAGWESPPADG